MADCINEVLKAIPEADKADVERIVKQMQDLRKQSAFLEGMGNPDSVYRDKAIKILNNYRKAALKEKVKTLQNMAKLQQLKEFTSNAVWQDATKGSLTFTNGKSKAIEALLSGSNLKMVEGNRMSADARRHAYANILGSGFLREITPEHIQIIRSGHLNKEITIATWNHSHKLPIDSKLSPTANDIGKAIANLDKAILRKLNDAGAMINELEGHTFLQSHDSELIKAAGFEKWLGDILPRLDHEKTFEGDIVPIQDKQEYLKGIYEDIVSNKPKIFQQASSDEVVKIIGTPSNMAARLGQQRKLHFKQGEALFEYNELYGAKDLGEYIHSRISSASRNAALMEIFGTNPRATFERMTLDATTAEKNWLNDIWKELDGSTSVPGKSTMSKVGATTRAVQNWSKLGSSLFASIPDTAARAANLFATNGQGLFKSINETFFGTLKNVTPSNQLAVAKLTGTGIDTILGQVLDRFGSQDALPGAISKGNDIFMRINLLSQWTNANKAGHAQTLSAWLGDSSHMPFASLPQAKNLSRYGIGPAEWEIIRSGIGAVDGQKYASLDGVESLSADKIMGILKSSGLLNEKLSPEAQRLSAEAFRNRTRDKLATYFNEEVRTAMNEPGAWERAFLLRGTQQDEVMGQVARMLAQFKSFPVTYLSKSFGDVMLGDKATSWSSLRPNVQGMTMLMAGTTIMAYVAESMRSFSRGQTPPDPENPETWVNMMQKGGALGLYGDFLLGEFDSRYGKDAFSVIAGPVLGQFSDVMDLKTQLMDGDTDGKVLARNAFRMILNNTPGANLFWLRGPADYLFLYSVQEHLNPGFVARTRERLREKGQEFIMEPTQ